MDSELKILKSWEKVQTVIVQVCTDNESMTSKDMQTYLIELIKTCKEFDTVFNQYLEHVNPLLNGKPAISFPFNSPKFSHEWNMYKEFCLAKADVLNYVTTQKRLDKLNELAGGIESKAIEIMNQSIRNNKSTDFFELRSFSNNYQNEKQNPFEKKNDYSKI